MRGPLMPSGTTLFCSMVLNGFFPQTSSNTRHELGNKTSPTKTNGAWQDKAKEGLAPLQLTMGEEECTTVALGVAFQLYSSSCHLCC